MIRRTIAIDDELEREIRIFAKKDHRDFSSAVRYTLRIGILAIENPELTVGEIKDIIEAQVDYEMQNTYELNLDDI